MPVNWPTTGSTRGVESESEPAFSFLPSLPSLSLPELPRVRAGRNLAKVIDRAELGWAGWEANALLPRALTNGKRRENGG